MAIQNFLSGGYYGKLGATVGQRWKNKRTVRAYVVPRNPRTPKQQANRGQFGNAVTFAQAGLQMNYYATCFENESFTRWNYRMKTARFLERESFEYLDLIPLYPPNFTPPQLITSIKILGTEGANKIIFSCPGLTFEEKRTFSMMFAFFTADGVFEGYKLYLGYYDPAIPEQIECTVDNVAEVNQFSRVRLVTNDDKDSATDMIASRMLTVETSGKEIRDFDTGIQSVSSTLTETLITFFEPYKAATTAEITATVFGVSAGQDVSLVASGSTLVNNNGFFALRIATSYASDKQRIAFPYGAQIEITEILAEGDTFVYTASNVTENITSSDLTRSLSTSDWANVGGSTRQAVSLALPVATTNAIASCSYSCGGRLGKSTPEVVSLGYSSQSTTSTTYEVQGAFGLYPCPSGSQIVIPATNFDIKGVRYSAPQTTLAVTNSITVSPFLTDNTPQKYRDGLEDYGDYLYNMYMSWSFNFTASSTAVTKPSGLQCFVEDSVTREGQYSESVDITIDNVGGGCELVVDFIYDDAVADWTPSRCVVTITPQNANITVGGVAYRLPNVTNESLANFPV